MSAYLLVFELAFGIFAFLIIALIFWYVQIKRKENVSGGLGLALFLVEMPEIEQKQGNSEEQLKNFFLQMEQFLNGFGAIKKSGWRKRFFGNPVVGLEIATHHQRSEIYFYVAFPRAYGTVLETNLHGAFPHARIRKVNDYNIFNPEGANAIAVIKNTDSPLLPIKTYSVIGSDPIEMITSAFSKIKEKGEGAAIQILIRPPINDIKGRISSAIKKLKEGNPRREALEQHTIKQEFKKILIGSKEKEKAGKEQPSPIDDATIKLLEEKKSKVIFECNITIATSAATVSQANSLLKGLEIAFSQFQNPGGNSFKVVEVSSGKFASTIERFSFRMFDGKNILLLNTEEIASIYHFPFSRKAAPSVFMLKAKEAAPPTELPNEGIMIGQTSFRGEEKVFRMTRDDRRRHFYIIGQTGTGKSTLMEQMMTQDIKNGEGVALIDPHGSSIDHILPLIPKERIEDVIYFDPADTAYPMGLNMLEYDARYPEYKSLVINELLEIFNKLFNMSLAGGPQFEQYFRNAAALVMENPESGNTVLDIRRVFSDKAFRDYKISQCKNIVVSTFWKEIAEKATGEQSLANMTAYVVSKFDVFLSNDIMRPIIMQEKSAFNFRDVMDQKKILMVNLAKGKLGETNSNLLGMIIISKILISALSRTDTPEEERKDFFLYIDEFQNVTTKSIATILSEARKYRLNLTIVHQFLGQIEDEVIKKSIFGNVGSMLAFRVGPEDAEVLEKQFAPTFSVHDLANIDNFHAYVKPLIHGLTVKPFNIKLSNREHGNDIVAQEIKKLSRLKYGRPREEIEAEIETRYRKL